MPVGATIGAAVVGAGAGLIGSSQQASATDKATAASVQAQHDNLAQARSMYDSNVGLLDPFRQGGLAAQNELLGLLLGGGSGGASATSAPAPAPTSGSFIDSGGTANSAMYSAGGAPAPSPALRALMGRTPEGTSDYSDTYISPGMSGVHTAGDGTFGGGGASPPISYGGSIPPGTVSAPSNPQSAWDTFRNSTNYQWRLGEGERALNQGYAANGSIQSGAAAKALLKYGQDYGSNELNNYMSLLAGQEGVGLNAARAVAGVGGDLTNQTINANNTAASSIGNAALVNGQNQAKLWNGIGSSVGTAIGALGGSSYGKGSGVNGIDYNSPAFTGNWGW